MRINTNVNAMIATNQMTKNTALSGASMEKLSTGLRITKAGDDATGLAISEKMRSQIRGMEQADRNVQDGISLVQTAEGSMEEIGNITQRMRELTVQAANETNSAEDREKITSELKQLNKEIDRISESTTFNNEKILNTDGVQFGTGVLAGEGLDDNMSNIDFSGAIKATDTIHIGAEGSKLTLTISDGNNSKSQTIDLGNTTINGKTVNFDQLGVSFDLNTAGDNLETVFGELRTGNGKDLTLEKAAGQGQKQVTIQAGANNDTNNTITVSIDAMTSASLGIDENNIDKIADPTIKDGTDAANKFITTLDNALEKINESRATLGAQQNRLEYASSNLTTSTENLSSAESRIRDVDVAKEMVKLSKLNILNQASQAMVSQAKQQPESVSQLLR